MSSVLDLIRTRYPAKANPATQTWVRTIDGSSALVFDSPHSGTQYPQDFGHASDPLVLRQAEDTHVDALFDFAPRIGIWWIEALFPRSYLDANRSERDVDPTMIDGAWTGPLETDAKALSKVHLGKGLIWKLDDHGVPIYRRKLQATEVLGRIERCWRPYHAAVARAIEAAHAAHGYCIHLNCHSMPSLAGSHATEEPGAVHPDFVLGDRDGTTASPRLTAMLADFLRGRGYSVAINHPYKGVELVRRYSNPTADRHSIQIEVNRKLYMNEQTLALRETCGSLKQHLQELARLLLTVKPSDLRPG